MRLSKQWETMLREFEIRCAFEGYAESAFDQGLELGCGRGEHSRFVAFYSRHLTATEINAAKLKESSSERITFAVGDAQCLSAFADASMDMIFSSQMLAHLTRIDDCLKECARVLKPEGIIVHTVPTRTWKGFNVLLFYPFLVCQGFSRLCGRVSASAPVQSFNAAAPSALDNNLRPHVSGFSLKKLFPEVHAASAKGHWDEFRKLREEHWLGLFSRNGLDVTRIVRLPFYFGYGYRFRPILKLGNYLGLSASTAYVLQKGKSEPTKPSTSR